MTTSSRAGFESAVNDYIELNSLATPAAKVGVALSGGADSVALLAVMTALGFDCVALHCNFRLRGDESRRDRDHARVVASDLGAGWEETEFDVEAYRRAHPDTSVEMACRELRYAWFADVACRLGLEAVALGHNAGDRAETFLLNAMRPSGLRGLTSMAARRDIYIRPLLAMTRRHIERYLTDRGLDYVTDRTNLAEIYRRNKLRLGVMAPLEERFPDAFVAIGRTMANLESTRELYDDLVSERASRYRREAEGGIDLAAIAAAEPHARQLLFEILSPSGISMEQIDSMLRNPGGSGLRFGSWLLDRGVLLPSPAYDEAPEEFDLTSRPDLCRMRMITAREFAPVRDPLRAWFDADILNRSNPLTVRRWRLADRMTPFGMRGTRLLSDIFSDAGLSVDAKRRAPVVECGGEIVWLPGLKNSAAYPVTPASSTILELTWLAPL